MLDFAGSLAPFQSCQIGTVINCEWVLGWSQQSARQRNVYISSTQRRLQLTTVAHLNGRSNLPERIASSGEIFARNSTQILGQNAEIEKLPVFFQRDGRQFQYASDGNTLRAIPVRENDEEPRTIPQTRGRSPKQIQIIVEGIRRAIYRTFIPDQVRPHYLAYVKWKFLHRFCSSVLQVQCTQAMLQAIGIGARRSLPAAAGLTWVLKDGLGRLGRFAFSGLLGSTFDSNLKKVRFSTSVLFSLSLGLEMLTPLFPNSFLLLATLANIGRSIALAAYLATTSAIHKSFAVGDNLANIAAKGQVQTVVADNLGLAVAVALGTLTRFNKRFDAIRLLAAFPILVGLDLYAIYQELQSIHLQTLNKARLEILVDGWLSTAQVRSTEEVSKLECQQFVKITGQKTLPLRIGALNPSGRKPNDILQAFNHQAGQPYAIFEETNGFIPFLRQPGLLLWLQKGYRPKDVITAMLQVGFMRSIATSKSGSSTFPTNGIQLAAPILQSRAQEYLSEFSLEDIYYSSRGQNSIIAESRQRAEANVDDLIASMERSGWQIKHILLDPQERQTYSTHLGNSSDKIQEAPVEPFLSLEMLNHRTEHARD